MENIAHTNNTPIRSPEPLGVYIHIPFCKSKCPYCDFCSFPHADHELMTAYVRRLLQVLSVLGEQHRHRVIDTVYFGGGTPTLLPPEAAAALLQGVRDHVTLLPQAEITLECNPATATPELLALWHSGGVNRLSMGAQSAHPAELKALGRLHSWGDVVRTLEAARGVGIDNINLDFMMGIPHQTPKSLLETLDAAMALSPDHLSAYCLMIEEDTPFGRRGAKALGIPDDDGMADLFELASARIRAGGYEHYEISNYARPHKRSRHNLHTWQGREYLGVGVAAHGYVDGVRYGNSRDLQGFLAGRDITETRVTLTPEDKAEEAVMLGLRLSDGIDLRSPRLSPFRAAPSESLLDGLVTQGLLRRQGSRIALTDRGFLVSNQVIALLWESMS